MARYLNMATPTGNMQIDDTYRNLVLVDKQTVTTYSATPRTLTPSALITSSFTGRSVVAITGGTADRAYADSGSFRVWTASNNVTVTAYFFAEVPQPNKPAAGVLIKNAAGEVVFNSDYLPMRVSGMLQVPNLQMYANDPWSEPGASLSLDPSRTYAVVLSHPRSRFQRDLDAYRVYVFEDQVTGGTGGISVRLSESRALNYSTDPYPPAQTVGGIALAIDVTHY